MLKDNKRAQWIIGLSGLGLVAIGALAYYRQRQALAGLGRGPYRQAPVVNTYSDGNMRTTLRASEDMPIEERIATIQEKVESSVQDPEMRKLALKITSRCPERDGECEARAVYHYVKNHVRYTGDIAPIKWKTGQVEGVDLYQSARRTLEFGGGDCLPAGTLLLTDRHEFVPIEKLLIGSRIWGRDQWTTVEDVWFKGNRSVDVIYLNNGSTFMATSDHKVYVALCSRHANRVSTPCPCPISERSIERIQVSQLEPDMVLIQPERIAFGQQEQDPRRAYIEGLFISDGWVGHDTNFDISGRDGHPKEAQKREVQTICEELGIPTTWQRKSIVVRDKAWTQRVRTMGGKAWLKHALSISLTEPAAAELLRGIMADSGANTNGNGRTFTTTSRELMLQTRVLHRMLGVSCSERYIVDHGGEGEHPIWRLGVRDMKASKAVKLLRVKSIERDVAERPVYDITTSDHYVYLPEADVVVSNCDDQSIVIATLLALNGITPILRVVRQRGDDDWTHIYAGGLMPKGHGRKFVALDTTLPGSNRFGVEVPVAKHRDFPA